MSFKSGWLRHFWLIIRPIKTAYLLVLFLIFLCLSIYGLRMNNQVMGELRNEVIAADRNDHNVEQALANLRRHVNGHMNTELSDPEGIYPPIQLEATYQRLLQAEQDRVTSENSVIYIQAQATCEQQFPAGQFQSGRLSCIEEFIKSHGTTAKPIPAALYKFDFASPVWSPDLAGWSLVAAIVFITLAIVRFVFGRFAK